MKTFNKIISLALCVFMLCSVMVMPAFAESEATGISTDTSNPKMVMTSGDIGTQVHWDYADGVLTISKPEGFTGAWHAANAGLDTKVTIGEKDYYIACPWGKYAFSDTAETIGAFAGKYPAITVDYSHIKKLVIEEGVKIIPAYTFYNNMHNASKAEQVTTPLKPVSHTALAEVVLPSTLETIGYTKIQDGIDKSYSNTFSGCTSLTKVNFADATSLKHIYSGAFADCPITGKVVMPKSLTVLGGSAFRTWDKKCGAITQFIVPAESKITSIGVGTFDAQDKLEYVLLPASVTSIGNYSFRKQNSAKVNQVLFLGNAPTISTTTAPFANNTKVYYSDKATGWDNAAVTTNTGLKEENVLKVSGIPSTFTDCGGINTTGLWFYDSASKTLDICGNGTAMGATSWVWNNRPWGNDRAANEIENIRINDGVTMNAFASSFGGTGAPHKKVKTMYVGDGVAAMGDDFLGTSPIETLTFSPNSALTSIGARAFANNELTEVILPDTVVSIGAMAFDQAWNTQTLKKIYLGKALKTIGDYAFRNHVAESIVIPARVTSIGQNAFSNANGGTNSNTKAIYFEGETAPTTIGKGAFNNCRNAKLFVKNSTVLPDGIGISYNYNPGTGNVTENMTLTSNVLPASKIYADLTLTNGKATARIYNFSDASKKFDLYSAAYDSNSALTAVTTKSATVAAGNKIPVITDLSTTTSGATKAFLWDSNLAPFAVVQ